MLDYKLLANDGVLEVCPTTPLHARDFAQLSEAVDRYLSREHNLKGVIIRTNDKPGWEDFSELVSHIEFIHDHHKQVPKIAAISNDELQTILPPIANHFAAAEVKHFDTCNRNEALDWISH